MNPFIRHILLLEDDPDDTDFFRAALEETHPLCQLTAIENGNQLTSVLSDTSRPDLIVLDYNLPGKKGTECLKEIRADRKFDEVPVIMLSAFKNPEGIDYCLSNGAVQYYLKPQTFSEVKEVVSLICSYRTAV